MAAFGQLKAALASVTNDVTVAAANLNFDFTLFKCEAPKEFQQLGTNLSRRRKDDAEHGSAHITARRLGALFEGMLPSTPCLLKAYGSRVSEIAQATKDILSPEPENTMFAAHSGIDGTSIWAAATSSATALHVQLLACMLARVWTANEATSVWFELIKERRRDIEEKWARDESLPFSAMAAATQAQVSRSSLAEWDASARSWLKTADRVKQQQQDQLMSLISKVELPINYDMSVYQSVISAWKSALESMENLVKGMPQAVNNGSCLLALSSWHIYPDILAAGLGESREFQDNLVLPGGMLTLGLNAPNGDATGIFWSLSLAHLNFYGRPVDSMARLHLQTRTITFEQFTQAIFGAFLEHMGFHGPDAAHPAEFLVFLRAAINRTAGSSEPTTPEQVTCSSWLRDRSNAINILTRVAEELLDTREMKGEMIHKLIALGRKRAGKFFDGPRHVSTFFGMNEMAILRLLKGPDERIRFLRRIASEEHLDQRVSVIRYYDTDSYQAEWGLKLCGLASTHCATYPHARLAPKTLLERSQCDGEVVSEMSDSASEFIGGQKGTFRLQAASTEVGTASTFQTFTYAYGVEDLAAIYIDESLLDEREIDPTKVFRRAGPTLSDLIWCLECDLFSMERLINHLDTEQSMPSALSRTLNAVSLAHRIYQPLSNATLSTKSLSSPLYLTKWALHAHNLSFVREGRVGPSDPLTSTRFRGLPPHLIPQEVAFACVANLETGYNIDPNSIKQVFAIAYEDSIYVSMKLLCDPFQSPNAYELKRVMGNIGRPGLTLLIPPSRPMVLQLDDSLWRLQSDTEYNYLPENHFERSSMHLSFSEFYVPLVQPDVSQNQDHQVHMLESIISVHHSGKWIGDVDVLRCLSSHLLSKYQTSSRTCGHKNSPNREASGLVSIQTWEDIIDPPSDPCVIRANGSWLARLATATIFIQSQIDSTISAQPDTAVLGDTQARLYVFPSSACTECIAPMQYSRGRTDQSVERIPGIAQRIVFLF